jgi:cytochrome c peroxidase
MSLANVAYAGALTWGNPQQTRLEDQALVPMFGDHPVELGLERPGTALLARLRQVAAYQRLVPAAFPGDADPFTVTNVTRAIAAFERTIVRCSRRTIVTGTTATRMRFQPLPRR